MAGDTVQRWDRTAFNVDKRLRGCIIDICRRYQLSSIPAARERATGGPGLTDFTRGKGNRVQHSPAGKARESTVAIGDLLATAGESDIVH